MRRLGGAFPGILACPCHLLVTLPLLTTLRAGTVLGSFLTQHTGLVSVGATIYFVVALVLWVQFLLATNHPNPAMDAACRTCVLLRCRHEYKRSPLCKRGCLFKQERNDDDIGSRTL